MRVTVVVFPGSNCDHDIIHVYKNLLGAAVATVWHTERELRGPDLVILPGGFAYGDYLRTGAMAKLSPIMEEVRKFALKGGLVLGVCNGFQILCEAGLLPGVLLQNVRMKFLSQFVHMKIESTEAFFTKGLSKGELVHCPIAHFEGNYFVDSETLTEIEEEGQVVFRYSSPEGEVDDKNLTWNPNGALNAIAGICNKTKNVVGLMPHPERATETRVGFVGGNTGLALFRAGI